MKTAVYTGSFDPVTTGHLDIIERASSLFDHVIVCILNNSEKKCSLFSVEERVIMLKDAVSHLPNVEVDSDQGLVIDYVKKKGADVIIRGLRQISDFEAELQMAQANRTVGGIETMFLASNPKYSDISSTVVREFSKYGVAVKEFVPENVYEALQKKIAEKQ